MQEALSDGQISAMGARELINRLIDTYEEEDEVERLRLQGLMLVRAGELKIATTLQRMIRVYDRKDRALELEDLQSRARARLPVQLKMNDKGTPAQTIDNFLTVMENDPYYAPVRYNLMTGTPEKHQEGKIARWTDSDEAESRRYIEEEYHIYSERKHADALRIFFHQREYNPILELVETLEWDGKERCERFLIDWAKAEDTPYTREVSRLIFAGGIHRLYHPGCKFDDVPILIGKNQGEGKSSLVRWLAIHDNYYSEVTEIDGQKGIEQLEGAWICEIAELLALTRVKEQEAVKAYITRQQDKYRRPYDRQTTELPRRCMFIGTTNNENPLKDKTGNRRFYPVRVHMTGYWLFEHEQECRDDILQCWAEARDKLLEGKLPGYADPALVEDYRDAQNEAMEDDWRVGVIEAYLEDKQPGDLVCIRQIMHEALSPNPDFPKDPTPKESQEIAAMMGKMAGWEKVKRSWISGYGQQRGWKKMENQKDSLKEVPF